MAKKKSADIDKVLYYPEMCGYIDSRILNEEEWKLLEKFFKTKIEKKQYRVCVWVEGKELDNKFGIIPVGIPYEICLNRGSSFKYRKNIQNIFNTYGRFEFEYKQKVKDWFYNQITLKK